jgi:hypothetical protein
MPLMSTADLRSPTVRARVALGAIAGPLFVSAFTAIGARRAGYDWRRHAVSSLGAGHPGWPQRSNFMLTGSLYLVAASGLARCPRQVVGARVVPVLVGAAGAGLIGAGVFVTDHLAGFPPTSSDGNEAGPDVTPRAAPSRSSTLHDLSAIPVFLGIPVAGMVSAFSSARKGEYRWAGYSVASSLLMVAGSVLFGAAFGGASRLVAKGGIFQRISIAAGFGWLTALSLRALASLRRS